MLLSDRTATTTTTGGYIHIIIPDAGSPSGYSSYRITVANFLNAVKVDELWTPDGTSNFVTTDNSSVLTVDGDLVVTGEISGLRTTKTVTNAGGSSSGAAATLTVDKETIVIEATDANRFYKLPATPTDGEHVKIIADGSNTTDVAIVTTNTNLTTNVALVIRDTYSFEAVGGTWLAFGGRTDN